MCERGRNGKRFIDFWAGIPLLTLAGVSRRAFAAKKEKPLIPRSIGVLCFAAIGDLLVATSLLNALSDCAPEAHICVYTSNANAGTLPLLSPKFEKRTFAISACKDTIFSLRKDNFDVLIDTTQWARISAIYSLLSRSAYTVGFHTPGQYRHFCYDFAVPHKEKLHESENFLNLARTIFPQAAARPSIHIPIAPPTNKNEMHLSDLSKIIFIHMWASGRHPHLKEWMPEQWAALALACWQAGYQVVLTGSSADADKNNRFLTDYIPFPARENYGIHSIAGMTSLTELTWLFCRAAAVVSVNTGIVHLAGLSGVRTFDLHGPTTPARWGACGPQVHHICATKDHANYLYLGFELPGNATPLLHSLSAITVMDTMRKTGIVV